jgi:DNA helicase-2/ATP-dependent DNA helicase PcrA
MSNEIPNKDEKKLEIAAGDSEKEYFQYVIEKMEQDAIQTEESIEYRKKAITAQKRYMRDSHGDMDDEEFLQNMNNVNNDTLFIDHATKNLNRLKNQLDAPYFGKILFQYDEDGEQLPVYVGVNGYMEPESKEQLVYDWRAPVSSMYYDYEKGKAGYTSPDGELTGTILEKKQFDISMGRYRDGVDTDEQINDRLLVHALSHNSGSKMKSVVATIQKEQNDIIRNTLAYNLVVDGRAGSGKTVIAMHRLAWLIYNSGRKIKSDNVMILSPNGIFGDYISNVLPEVGEDNVPEKEFDSLMEEILFIDCDYENKLSQSDTIIAIGDMENDRIKNIIYKSSIEFYNSFNKYLEDYVSRIEFRDFHFEKTEFTKEELEKMFYNRFSRYPVYERFEKIAYFIADRVNDLKNQELSDEKLKKMEKQISREMIYQYAERNLITIYTSFLETLEAAHPGISNMTNEYGKICYEDILPIFYMQIYFYGCNSYDNIKHLVIDEMQDYNIFQYAVLDRIFKCRKTILGDKYQVLFYKPEETIIDVIKTVFVPHSGNGGCQIKELLTSYRSTQEITDFCNQIISTYNMVEYEASDMPRMVNRHGNEPEVYSATSEEDEIEYIVEKMEYGDMDSYDNVAVLCEDEAQAYHMYKLLSEHLYITYLTNQSTVYNGGLVVLPKFLAKGMEFDAVFVINSDDSMRNMISRRAYYISCTRALHELYVINEDYED